MTGARAPAVNGPDRNVASASPVADVKRAHFAEALRPGDFDEIGTCQAEDRCRPLDLGTSSNSMLPRDGMTLLSEILPAASSSWKIFT